MIVTEINSRPQFYFVDEDYVMKNRMGENGEYATDIEVRVKHKKSESRYKGCKCPATVTVKVSSISMFCN